jgi:outer membrane protein assembly factor BamB
MRRWLVALALAVVATPDAADARCLTQTRTVTATTKLTSSLPARIGRLPTSLEIDQGVLVVHANGKTTRHVLGRRDGVSWLVTVGSRVMIGFAANRGPADTILAVDHVTGAALWRRSVDSLSAAELAGNLMAIERAGTLDVVDVRDGTTVGTTAIAGQTIQSVSRGGDLYLKTRADLIAIDRATGAVRWRQPTTSFGNVGVTAHAVVDAWVDRDTHRYGIVRLDAMTGRRLDAIDLGATGGWYDRERVEVSSDGPDEVMVSAMFAVA